MGITPNNSADFDPAMGNYNDLRPFRFWCQKVLPLVYDDSLSYYEVLCKVVDYLNKTMEDVGVLHDDVDALHVAYQQLQSYVNNYFSNLDVQQEINNKLDVMASDGTLDALLLPYFNEYKTEINTIINTQNQNITDFEGDVNTAIASQNSQINLLSARMDTFTHLTEGSTTGDAELADIRVGYNGTTYNSAGDAVRAQAVQNPQATLGLTEATTDTGDMYYPVASPTGGMKKISASTLNKKIENHQNIISSNLMGIDVQQNLYTGASDWSGFFFTNSDIKVSSSYYLGYPVVHSIASWRRCYKTLAVEAGKTYTFESWFKQSTAGSAFLYMVFNDTTNPATLSVNSKQFGNIPANTWTKLSVTFTCTSAGNITPFALSSTGAFDICKYVLVEGDKVFNLKDTFDGVYDKIGDYNRYDFSTSNTETYWNNTFDKVVPSNTKCKIIFNSYSGSNLSYIRLDGKKQDGTWTNRLVQIVQPTFGESAEFVTTERYIGFRVQFTVTEPETNVNASVYFTTNAELGVAYDLLQGDENVDSLFNSVGDYKKYDFSTDATGVYWNNTFKKNVATGVKCRLIFDKYTGLNLNYVRLDGEKEDGTWTNKLVQIMSPSHGSSAEFIASEDYVGFRVQFAITESESNINASVYMTTTSVLGLSNDMLQNVSRRVFHINKDGSGDFSSFVDGINEACKYMDSIVYVGAGTYNLLEELGEEYVESASHSHMGLVLKNRVHVICSTQTVLEMKYDGQLSNVKEYLSPINSGEYGFTLENARIEDENVRYSVHDDLGGSGSTPYTNKMINCTMIHKNGMYGDCIGGGVGENGYIEIRGCYLEGDTNVERLAYYHGNNNSAVTNAQARITVCDNYFANVGTFKLTNYGNSETITTAYLSNNSLGATPSVNSGSYAPYVNMNLVAWNNEIRSN